MKKHAASQRPWLALLLLVSTVLPALFGIPIPTTSGGGSDANFALGLVHGYYVALRGGVLLPRWLQTGNMGYGAPVFYFYGRLPYLCAGLVQLALHCSSAAALAATLAAARITAFFTCFLWLRRYASEAAAAWSALAFIAFPFAALYNPLVRVGLSEIAATAIVPLCLLSIDHAIESSGRLAWRHVALLAVEYAVLAAIHLPQTLLVLLGVTVYALLRGGLRGGLLHCLGSIGGLFLSASNVLPAMLMQRLISAGAWNGDADVVVGNNYLFSAARYHRHSTQAGELYLHSSWLLCAAIAAAFGWTLWRDRARPSRRARALLASLVIGLLCMTAASSFFWQYAPGMHTLQFPWRVFPATLALAAALLSLLLAATRRPRSYHLLIGLLIAAEAMVPLAGYLNSAAAWPPAQNIPFWFRFRLPVYVAPADRDEPLYELPRQYAPEYVPASAMASGWRSVDGGRRLARDGSLPDAPHLPAGLHMDLTAVGAVHIRGSLAQPGSILLHCFWFPDERVQGTASSGVREDAATALARVDLPAGPVDVVFDHGHVLPPVRIAYACDVLGALFVAGCCTMSRRRNT